MLGSLCNLDWSKESTLKNQQMVKLGNPFKQSKKPHRPQIQDSNQLRKS